MSSNTELSVVIAVFNEAGNIQNLVKLWRRVFAELDIHYQFIFLNDGSTDNSLQVLNQLAADNTDIKIYSHQNMGHGPSILKGYQLALQTNWIFQIDGDSQYATDAFACMWNKRNDFDFLLGQRSQENASLFRKLISAVSVLTVKLLCGVYLRDVNTPYRLMRSSVLKVATAIIPAKTFAPNILITMFCAKTGKRISASAISYNKGTVAKKSRMNLYFARGAALSFFQTVKFRARL